MFTVHFALVIFLSIFILMLEFFLVIGTLPADIGEMRFSFLYSEPQIHKSDEKLYFNQKKIYILSCQLVRLNASY